MPDRSVGWKGGLPIQISMPRDSGMTVPWSDTNALLGHVTTKDKASGYTSWDWTAWEAIQEACAHRAALGTFSGLASQVTCSLYLKIHKTSPNICPEECEIFARGLSFTLLSSFVDD